MPAKEPRYHTHPRNVRDLPIFGIRLEVGDVIEPSDVYDSTNGLWEPTPCPGCTLGEGITTICIRPVPVPPERELVRVGNVLMERGSLPSDPETKDEESAQT